MILSAPAPAVPQVPAVSLASLRDSKAPNASTTTPFKNFFDSLTHFEDLRHEGGARQEGSALPQSFTKKELQPDSTPGTEQAVVLQIQSPGLPKSPVILPQTVLCAVPENHAGLKPEGLNQDDLNREDPKARGPQSASLRETGDAVSLLITAKSQPASPTGSLPDSPLPYKTGLDVPSATSTAPARNATSTKETGAVATFTPTKAQVTANPFETHSEAEPEAAAQQMGPLTGEPTDAPHSIPQPLAVKSVSIPPPERRAAEQVQPKPVQTEATNLQAIRQEGAPQAASLSLRRSAPLVPSSTSSPAEKVVNVDAPPSSPILSSLPNRPRQIAAPSSRVTDLGIQTPAPAPQLSTKPATEKPVPSNATAKQNVTVETVPPVRVQSPSALPKPTQQLSQPRDSATAKQVPANVTAKQDVPTAPPVKVQSPSAVSKPAQQLSQAREQVRPSQQTPLPDQIAPPAVPDPQAAPSAMPPNMAARTANSEQTKQPTSLAESTVPPATMPAPSVSSVDREPEPTVATAPMAVETSSRAPLPVAHDVVDRASETSSLPAPQHDVPAATSAPKATLLPAAENFAFAVRMLGLESFSRQTPVTESKAPVTSYKSPVRTNETPATTNQTPVASTKGPVTQPQASGSRQPVQPRAQTSNGPQREASSSAPEPEKSGAITQKQSDLLRTQQMYEVTPRWNEAAAQQAPEIGSLETMNEPMAAARPNLPLAAQETHLSAPEPPRTSAGSEILLHLTGNDQSSAAIRVADRAGSVNVSVHASDPVLRESLRSNLSELSTQLNTQGWKADLIKSAAVATHSESQQDSHGEGQRGSQQQQSSGGDRQPQRDRRSNSGQWQQDLEQQITGGDVHPGGNE